MKVATLIHILVDGNMVGDLTSNVLSLDQIFGLTIQANYTTMGTLAGTLKLQVSVDHVQDTNGNVIVAGNWVDMTGSPIVISGAGSYVWNVSSVNYPFIRLVYAHHSGDSGTLNAFACVKGI